MRLGILIPYYNNHPECENRFRKLMKTINKQMNWDIFTFIYEDGQRSNWLRDYEDFDYKPTHIWISSNYENKGIAYARNYLLESVLGSDVDYIMFLDSDDMIDCDFIRKMYEAAETNEYDMIISKFIMNKKEIIYDKRSNVAGICLRTEFIKGLTFNEDYNISEDALFISDVYKRNPRIGKIDSNYYYNYGANPDSLMMRFERSELNLMKE